MFDRLYEAAVKALMRRAGAGMTSWIMAIVTGLILGIIGYVIVDNVTGSVTLTGLGGTIIGYAKVFFALFIAFLPTIGLNLLGRSS